jgi:hypothetical protein
VKWSRALAIVILLYVGGDLLDPSIRGVFFFDSAHFFMDGAIHQRSDDVPATAPTPPLDARLDLETIEPPSSARIPASVRESYRPRCLAVARTDTSAPDASDPAAS